MVSFLQVQCLNCGVVDDVIAMDSEGESSWCSQVFQSLPSSLCLPFGIKMTDVKASVD